MLHQEHRQANLPIQAPNDVANFCHHIGLDPLGGLIQDQQFRIQHQSATDGQLLLLAAGEIPAPSLLHGLEYRKQLVDERRDLPLIITPRGQADAQILFDRQQGEDLPPLGHITNPQLGAPLHRQRGDVLTIKPDLSALERQLSHQGIEQCGLAHTITAHQAEAFPLL